MFNFEENFFVKKEVAVSAEKAWNIIALKVTEHVKFIEKLPFPIRWVLLKFKIKPLFTEHLSLSMPGFVSCAETGKQVKRNQFGFHPIFSPEI